MRGTFILLLEAACSSEPPISGGHGGAGGAGGSGGSGGGMSTVTAVALPQALDGAMQANPYVYPMLPVRVAVTGHPLAVRVRVDPGVDWTAAQGDGTLVAQLPIQNLD